LSVASAGTLYLTLFPTLRISMPTAELASVVATLPLILQYIKKGSVATTEQL